MRLSLFALPLLLACGHGPHVGGVVTAAACDSPSARPLAGAQVIVRCADRPAPILTATSDETGRFDADPEHPLPRECTFEISRDGYLTRTFQVAEVCAVSKAAVCTFAGLTVELRGGPQ